jgi:predicted metal-binding membrane protein
MTDTDRPRLAYRALETRATVITAGTLVVLAAVAWWLTVQRAHDMQGMVQGLGSVGAMMAFDMSAGVFLAMWVTMMVAMMFPTIAPIVLLHRMVMQKQGAGTAPTVAFVAGYLVSWAIAGLVPLAVLLGVRHITAGASWVAPTAGVVLIVAGAYQFTAWKEVCQKACRTPLTFLTTHSFGTGLRGAARTGAVHGLYCLGCCWALMAVLVVVGLMNLVWMAAIAVIFLAEKHWEHGLLLTKVAGIGIAGLGVAILFSPSVLTSISN